MSSWEDQPVIPEYLLSFERRTFHTEPPDHYAPVSACAACRPPSQAPFAITLCGRLPIGLRAPLRSLRYAFGGDHPQSNYPPNAVLGFTKLVPRRPKGRISTTAPRTLACPPRRLRPILHIDSPGTTLSYSKGSRGLFVPSRVIGIFTDTTISLGSRLRQCPDHYTIRAGRNLPDKEFRYLRTVIVTAAVYRGFNSKPSHR